MCLEYAAMSLGLRFFAGAVRSVSVAARAWLRGERGLVVLRAVCGRVWGADFGGGAAEEPTGFFIHTSNLWSFTCDRGGLDGGGKQAARFEPFLWPPSASGAPLASRRLERRALSVTVSMEGAGTPPTLVDGTLERARRIDITDVLWG